MKSEKIQINNSAYVGVLGVITNDVLLTPHNALKKELKLIEKASGLKPFQIKVAESPLLGAFLIAHKKRIAVTELATDYEIEFLESCGFEVGRVEGITAIGNLFTVINEKVLGPKSEKNSFKKIEEILGLNVEPVTVAQSSLIGSSIIGNKNGFVVGPEVTEEEFKLLEKILEIEGTTSTANYGDRFLGNSVLTNDNCILFGSRTSSHEIFRIEDVLVK